MQRELTAIRSERTLVLGKAIYKQACLPCHGIRGNGKGPAAEGLDPPPRDFTAGVFKWRSTVSGSLPTDEDLERTIRRGVAGTKMIGWGEIFSKRERWAVIEYIKSLSPFFSDPDYQPTEEEYVEVPLERPFRATPDTITAGEGVYTKQGCGDCHGTSGKGDGPKAKDLVDDWERPIKVPDLTKPFFKVGKADRDIFRIFTTGLNGTPMPAFDELTDEQRWQLVDYIKSIEQRQGLLYYLFQEEPSRTVLILASEEREQR